MIILIRIHACCRDDTSVENGRREIGKGSTKGFTAYVELK